MSESAHAKRVELVLSAAAAGERLDRALAGALASGPDPLSRSRLKTLIEEGRVSSGGRTLTDPSARVKPGQPIAIAIPDARPAEPQPQAIALSVVYEDEALIVIDKPAGLVVHPAPGNEENTLVNALIAHCGASLSGIGGVRRPGIVHRLDKDTSGLMVAAKTDAAHRALSAQFAAHEVERAYLAVAWGMPAPRSGEIAGNIGRHRTNRKKMAVVPRGGKAALTRYRVVRALGPQASLVECRLATGRTHQVRVHLASLGHPVIGDPLYGRARPAGLSPAQRAAVAGFRRQALHARLLGFLHPASRERMRWESALPADMAGLIRELELI